MAIDILKQQKTDIIYRDVNIGSFKNVDLSDIHTKLNILDTYWDNIMKYLFDYCVTESEKVSEPIDYTKYSVFDDSGEFHECQISIDKILSLKTKNKKYINGYTDYCGRLIQKSTNNQLPDNIKPCNIYYFNDDITTFIMNFHDIDCIDDNGVILSINVKIYNDMKTIDINHPSVFFTNSMINAIHDK